MDFLEPLKNITWHKPDWEYPSVVKVTRDYLSQCLDLAPPQPFDDLEEIVGRSKAFPIQFPIHTVRLETLKSRRPIERLKRNIVSTYPLIHERVLVLMTHFLTYKREFGSSIEKDFYKDMTVPEFIERILKKRAVSFYGQRDRYLLITGEKGMSGWELVGSAEQKPPLILENCLSYDEMKISALVYVSGYTDCINNGTRKNAAVVKEDDIEENVVMIGLIGPRLKRRSKMDYEEILVTKEQNTVDNCYGDGAVKNNRERKHAWRRMWSDFYQIDNVTFERAMSLFQKQNKLETRAFVGRYHHKKNSKLVFDNHVYYKRLSIIADTTLLEAEHRAAESGQFAFINVVGCGLGVWMVSAHQTDVYTLTFMDRIHRLLTSDRLNHVSDVNFAYIKAGPDVEALFTEREEKTPPVMKLFLEYKQHPKGGINIQMQNREPSQRLSGEHEGKLLVLTYPWDSNAHPGNEWWCGLLASTGDSAAASSTEITELHNAYINPGVAAHHTKVGGRHGIKALPEYCRLLTQ